MNICCQFVIFGFGKLRKRSLKVLEKSWIYFGLMVYEPWQNLSSIPCNCDLSIDVIHGHILMVNFNYIRTAWSWLVLCKFEEVIHKQVYGLIWRRWICTVILMGLGTPSEEVNIVTWMTSKEYRGVLFSKYSKVNDFMLECHHVCWAAFRE